MHDRTEQLPLPDGNSQNFSIFEPDIARKEDEKEFYKSNQNFYQSEKDKPPSCAPDNQTISIDYIKQEINESNRISNYTQDIEKTQFNKESLLDHFVKNDEVDEYNDDYLNLSVESI